MVTNGSGPPDEFEWIDEGPPPGRGGVSVEAFNTGERDSFRPVPRPDPPVEEAPVEEPALDGDDLDTTEERPGTRTGRAARRRRRGGTREHERRARTRPRPRLRRRRLPRRELPARVRRRQDVVVGAIAAAVVAAGVVLLAGGGGGTQASGIPLPRLAGQTIVAKMGPGGPDKRMLREARAGRIGGLVVLPHDARALRTDLARVQKAAKAGGNPPLLVMIDQEGGYVKRLPGPPNTSPNDLGRSGDPNAARAEGQSTGSFLAGLGVDVDLAPLVDVSTPRTADTIASRTYGSDPATVSRVGVAFIQGLQAGGVAATAKHFPGLGLSTEDTDFGGATVQATPAEQTAALAPFKAVIDAGVDLVMVSTAVYPNLGSQDPAALSSAIVTGQLRDRLGFKGPIITDDLEGRAISDRMSPEFAAVSAIRAGDDLLLFAHRVGTGESAFRGIVKAARAGRLDQSTLQAAYDRVLALKRSLRR